MCRPGVRELSPSSVWGNFSSAEPTWAGSERLHRNLEPPRGFGLYPGSRCSKLRGTTSDVAFAWLLGLKPGGPSLARLLLLSR